MARFSYEEADNYGSSGSSNFFQLKNDNETARVRILYRSPSDIEGLSVHEVKIGDKKRYVNCLRNYTDPIDMCPLCNANYKIIAKVFVPLYDEATGEMKIWERGKKFFGQLTDLCSRYGDLVKQPMEIIRHGKPQSTDTTYNIWPMGQPDDTRLEDLPERVDILAKGIVLDKSAEEMDYYLRYNEFPESGLSPSRNDTPRQDNSQQFARRTPSRGDVFN